MVVLLTVGAAGSAPAGGSHGGSAALEARRRELPDRQVVACPLPTDRPRAQCLSEYSLAGDSMWLAGGAACKARDIEQLKAHLDCTIDVVPVCVRDAGGLLLALMAGGKLAPHERVPQTLLGATLLRRARLVAMDAKPSAIDAYLFPQLVKGACSLEYQDPQHWRNATRVFASFRECTHVTDNAGNMVWLHGAMQLSDAASTILRSDVELIDVGKATTGSIATGCLAAGLQSVEPTAMLFATANLLVPGHATRAAGDIPSVGDDRNGGTFLRLLTMSKIYRLRIEQLNVPTAILGIGTQIEFGNDGDGGISLGRLGQKFVLDEGQVALLAAVANRSKGGLPNIGTRGDLTQAVCRNAGVHACISLGCPSLLINPKRDLGRVLEEKWTWLRSAAATNSSSLRIIFTMPAVRAASSRVKVLERLYLNLGRRFPRFLIVLQTPHEMEWITLLRRNMAIRPNQIRTFRSVPDWIEALKGHHLLVGARIHGSMAATAAEVPTITIASDYRISELASRMLLPTVLMHELQDTELESLLRHVSFDGHAFDANRAAIARIYAEMLGALGVDVAPRILALTYQ